MIARGIGVSGPVALGVVFRVEQYNVGIVEVDGNQLAFSAIGLAAHGCTTRR